ncbi:MAG: Uma2 family endonuclease [Planctomycetaceae bacterium]
MSSAAIQHYSPADYLALERASEFKHEFFDGEMFRMSGGTIEHSQIAGNVIGELRSQLALSPCRVLTSDMRIKLPTGLYTYPDASVVCDAPQFEDDHKDVLVNPLVVVEVLSPSTEAYDRGKKFRHYQTCPSLREIVLIAQDRAGVDHFLRQPASGQWLLTTLTSLDAGLSLPTLGITLSLGEIYAKIEFPPEE